MANKAFQKLTKDFKEHHWHLYNILSSKEKQEFKEYVELGNMLEKVLEDMDFNIDGYGDEIFERYIRYTQKLGYKKPFGAKVTARHKDKVFIYRRNKDYVIYQTPTRTRTEISVAYVVLRQFKTPRGLHYMFFSPGRDLEIIFSSHFFDRYLERNNHTGNREDAILKLFITLKDTHHTHYELKEIKDTYVGEECQMPYNYTCEIYLQDGMGVGRSYIKDEDTLRHYYQTYLSLDIMRNDQLEKHAEAFMAGLDKHKREQTV